MEQISPSKPLGKIADGSYFAGRTIHFGLSIVGTVIDLALQFFSMILATPMAIIVKGETLLRKCDKDDAYSRYCLLPAMGVHIIRQLTTENQLSYLAGDVELIANYVKTKQFSIIYGAFLESMLF